MKASPSAMQGGAFGDLVMKSVVSSLVKLFFVEADPWSSTAIAGEMLCTRLTSRTSICGGAWGVFGETSAAQPGCCDASICCGAGGFSGETLAAQPGRCDAWMRSAASAPSSMRPSLLYFSPNHSVTKDFNIGLCGCSAAVFIPSIAAAFSRRSFIETFSGSHMGMSSSTAL